MERNIAICYCIIIVFASVLLVRIFSITQNQQLKQAAVTQSSFTLDVGTTRGTIYDCNLTPMVNSSSKYLAAISPSPEAFSEISKKVTGTNRRIAIENLHAGKPFLLPVDYSNIYAKGISIFDMPIRYDELSIGHHIIGYCNGDGVGVSGIEKSYDNILKDSGSDISVIYTTDAGDTPLPTYVPEIVGQASAPKGGVVLTIDRKIQQIAEDAMQKIDCGAAVVMDVHTGEIKAAVSRPDFDPLNVSKSLDDELSPLLNRCFIPYSVGSTFKIVVSLAALEQGISNKFSEYCEGYTEVNGIRFGCHYSAGHRWCDMERALMISCNPYFVKLGLALDMRGVLSIASAMGFGKETELAPNLFTAAGYLPKPEELLTDPDIANLSFGQGRLMATPVQVAQMICTTAGGGKSVVPSLVKGVTSNGQDIYMQTNKFESNTVVSKEHADQIKNYLISVVEGGSGENAKPEFLGAGGKTASAQTGQFKDGEEIVHAWFAGFYPAFEPQYAIVVLEEGGILGGESAAPVFKEICDNIYEITNWYADEGQIN